MKYEKEERIIRNYIESYNNFDIKGMIKDFHNDVIFENLTNGKVDLLLNGKTSFEQQAATVIQYFKTRNQKIESWNFTKFSIIIDIHYTAVVARGFSNGLEPGDSVELRGKSEFVIEGGKIKLIRDYNTR